jgi:hypothetical protein
MSHHSPPHWPSPDGPLFLPLPQTPSLHLKARRLGERLRAHTTSDLWLVEGVSLELDALREEHLARRSRLAAAVQATDDLTARFAREDREHEMSISMLPARARRSRPTRARRPSGAAPCGSPATSA